MSLCAKKEFCSLYAVFQRTKGFKCMFLHAFPDDTNMKRKTLRNALCNVGVY